MWHAYNLIATGDRVRATAVRKVQRESATGTVGAEKIKCALWLRRLVPHP